MSYIISTYNLGKWKWFRCWDYGYKLEHDLRVLNISLWAASKKHAPSFNRVTNKMERFIFIGTIVSFLIINTYCFPDGAPVDACVKPRPNQPYHGQARPQHPDTNPFQIIASSDSYYPGQQITGKYFKC